MNITKKLRYTRAGLLSMLLSFLCSTLTFAGNPLDNLWGADPQPMQGSDGKMYLFCTHSGPDINIYSYRVYSSDDLVDWTDHGVVITTDDVSWAVGKCWAPAAAYRNGIHYFYPYFANPAGSGYPKAAVGVITSKNGAGPYTLVTVDAPLVDDMHDPGVYVDDDGTAIMFNGKHCVELNPHMVNTIGPKIKWTYIDAVYPPEEGAFIFKRNGIYYMTQSPKYDFKSHAENVIYYTSSKCTGLWTYQGIIMDPVVTPATQTRHASGYSFHGIYMLWYHTLVDGKMGKRRPCAEYLHFNDDASIQKVIPTVEGLSYYGNSAIR